MDMLLEQFKVLFDRPEKVKKLRELILQFAVRGKLVEQDENDEPAAVLLEEIKEEKDRLIREGKIKQKLLPEIREDEKPYELPKGWEWARLGELYNIVRGSSPRPKGDPKYFTFEKTDYHWVTIKDITNFCVQDVLLDTIEYLTYEGSLKSRLVEDGEIIIAVSGSVGKTAKMGIKGYIYDGLAGLKYIIKEQVLRDYIFSYLKCWKDEINNMSEGTSFPNINTDKLNNLVIPLPPLSEQKRIIEKIDSLMNFFDKLEKQLKRKAKYSSLSSKSVFNSIGNCSSPEELEETLRFIIENFKNLTLGDGAIKELKNAILQLAVQGKLVPQDPSDEPASVLLEKIKDEKERLISEGKIKRGKPLPEISDDEIPYPFPESWRWIRLGKIIYSTDAGKSPNCLNEPTAHNSWGVIKTTAIQKDYFLENQNKVLPPGFLMNDAYIINKGDVLITRAGPKNRVGVVCYVDKITKKLILSDKTIRFKFSDSLLFHRYISLALNSSLCRPLIESKMTGMAESQVNISQNNMSLFCIPLPPLNEQKRIVEKVDFLMTLCDELEKRIEKSKKYSEKLLESLLKEAFKA